MSERIKGFDGIRGLAASAVVLHHYGYRGTVLGDVAVLVFFVLSGFLIVGILHSMRQAIESGVRSTGGAIQEFWRHRILRIFPAFYLVLAAAYIGEIWVGYVNLADGLPWYLTFTQNFYVAWVQPFWLTMSHTWTIAVEQQFYLLIAPLLLLIPSRLQWALVVAIVLTGATMTMALHGIGVSNHALRLLPFHGMAYIAAGGLTYFVAGKLPAGALDGIVPLACTSVLLVVSQPAWVPAGWAFTASAPIANGLCLAASCALIASCAVNQQARWVGWLEWRPLVYLGTISYGLYIVHVPLTWAMASPFHALIQGIGISGPLYGWAFFGLVFGASVAAASLLWFGVERPILRLKGRPALRPATA